jgi:hypothetical protein
MRCGYLYFRFSKMSMFGTFESSVKTTAYSSIWPGIRAKYLRVSSTTLISRLSMKVVSLFMSTNPFPRRCFSPTHCHSSRFWLVLEISSQIPTSKRKSNSSTGRGGSLWQPKIPTLKRANSCILNKNFTRVKSSNVLDAKKDFKS